MNAEEPVAFGHPVGGAVFWQSAHRVGMPFVQQLQLTSISGTCHPLSVQCIQCELAASLLTVHGMNERVHGFHVMDEGVLGFQNPPAGHVLQPSS